MRGNVILKPKKREEERGQGSSLKERWCGKGDEGLDERSQRNIDRTPGKGTKIKEGLNPSRTSGTNERTNGEIIASHTRTYKYTQKKRRNDTLRERKGRLCIFNWSNGCVQDA